MLLENRNLAFEGEFAAIPAHMQEALLAYIQTGRRTGSFLQALLSNDLRNAVARADSTNLPLIPLYVRWLERHMPGCFGSPAIVASWRGLEGEST